MALYTRDIRSTHQAIRVILGVGLAIAAFALLDGPAAWLTAASGIIFALTGIVGYCPMCAIAGVGRRSGS
jgi:Protein of unknown function (DUF2892)